MATVTDVPMLFQAVVSTSSVIQSLKLVQYNHPEVCVPIEDSEDYLRRLLAQLKRCILPSYPIVQDTVVRTEMSQEEVIRESEGCKALLLEIIRRAAYDWVLYRTSRRIPQRHFAEDAYIWLFQEDEQHPRWSERSREGKHLTSFVGICEVLDLDPDKVRGYIRKLTAKKVMSAGRPPDYRSSDTYERDECSVTVDLESIDPSGGIEEVFPFAMSR